VQVAGLVLVFDDIVGFRVARLVLERVVLDVQGMSVGRSGGGV
jgi:hypothetical protein